MSENFIKIPCFGVAGNFTGHLEQAGEDRDFKNIKVNEENAPKAIFPTYLPSKNINKTCPEFLKTFPFSSDTIIFPSDEQKIQIESECGIIFDAKWKENELVSLKAKSFVASNDCSIRKQGAKKISEKKNWGSKSKGVSKNKIEIDKFSENGILNSYRIASFLIRNKKIFDYGEDSAIKNYSYIYDKLIFWMLEKFNKQKNEGPAENIHDYLLDCGKPEQIFVSIGATRYTEFGEQNFLQENDETCVILYPENKYNHAEIKNIALNDNFNFSDICVLKQRIVLGT